MPRRPACRRRPDGRAAAQDELHGVHRRPVEGLFAPGQLVAFEFLAEATSGAPDDGSLDWEADWPKAGQRAGGFEATSDRQVLCAFVDPTDPSARTSPPAQATARFTDLPQTQDQLRASFAVQGLKRGHQVVVEVWLAAPARRRDALSVLTDLNPQRQGRPGPWVDIVEPDGRLPDVVLRPPGGSDPHAGRQRRSQPRLQAVGAHRLHGRRDQHGPDGDCPAARLDAFLDQQTKLANIAVTDNEGSITSPAWVADPYGFSCNIGFMNPGQTVKLVATVAVQPGAETRWTKEDPGCSGDLVDVCGQFVLSWKQTPSDRWRGAGRAAERHPRRPAAVGRQAGAQGPLCLLRPEADLHLPGVERGRPPGRSTSCGSAQRVQGRRRIPAGTANNNARLDPGESGTTRARSSRCPRTRPRASVGWRRSPTTASRPRSRPSPRSR